MNAPVIDEFNVSMKNILYTDKITKNRNLIRYILLKFYTILNKTVVVDNSMMTIEHIFPQNPSVSNQMTDEIVGNIGNMIIVSGELNRKLANKTFLEKKKVLIASGYILDPILNEATEWNEEQVLNRLEWMSNEAYNVIWKI